MAYVLGEPTVQQYFDANGDPLENGTIEFYLAGTSTPTPIYSDSSGTSLGTSVTLNSVGAPQTSGGTPVALFFDTAVGYKIIRKDSSGTAIEPTIDPYYVLAVAAASTGYVRVFATVAAMIAATDLNVGDRVQTFGYVSSGDGGDNNHLIVAAGTGTHDGATYTNLATHQSQGLFPGGEYKIEQFGAKGDGSTEDSAAFIAAAALGKTIELDPTKVYLLNTNIPCVSKTCFVSKKGIATIKSTSAASLNIFSGSAVTDNHFENILFDLPVCNASLDITPMDFVNVTRFSAHKCLMINGYSLIHIFGGVDIWVTQCRASLPYSYGVIFADDISRLWVLDGYYHGSIAHDGIKIAGSVTAEAPVHKDIHINGNTCYDNNRDGIDVAINDGERLNITGNILYNNDLTGIEFKLLDTDPVKLKRCMLQNNIIEVSTDSAVGITVICASASDIGKLQNVAVISNNIECTSTNNDCIKITSVDKSFVRDNDLTGGVNAINSLGSRNSAVDDNTADGQTNFLRLATDGTNANSNLKVLDNEARNLVSAFYSVVDASTSGIEHSNNTSDAPIDTLDGSNWSFRVGSNYIEAVTSGTKNLYASSHGTHYTNDGATGNTVFSINHVYPGMTYTFSQTDAATYTMNISPPAGVTIGGGGSGKDMLLNTNDGTVTIRAISLTKMEIVSDSGVTITYEP